MVKRRVRTQRGNTSLIKKANRLAAKWKKSRKAEVTLGLTCPDGRYTAQIKNAKIGEANNKEKSLYFNFTFSIVEPEEYKNQSGSINHLVKHVVFKDGEQTEEDVLERVAKDLQRLGYETADMEIADMIAAIEEIAKEKPMIIVQIKNREGKDPIVYFQGLADYDDPEDDEEYNDEEEEDDDESDYEDEEEDSEEYDEEEEEYDDEEDDEEEEEDEEEDDEVDVPPPEKGEEYSYRPPRARKDKVCTVKTVNNRSQTVTLEDEDGKLYKSVPFDELV